jgi:hypothetical protein
VRDPGFELGVPVVIVGQKLEQSMKSRSSGLLV